MFSLTTYIEWLTAYHVQVFDLTLKQTATCFCLRGELCENHGDWSNFSTLRSKTFQILSYHEKEILQFKMTMLALWEKTISLHICAFQGTIKGIPFRSTVTLNYFLSTVFELCSNTHLPLSTGKPSTNTVGFGKSWDVFRMN